MPDLLAQSAAWLEAQRTRHLSRLVRYRRGEQAADVPATVGKTVFDLDDGGGGMLRVETRDYLIMAADLAMDGAAALPARGDRIIDDGHEYEVLAPGNEPCWRYSDPYRITLRVHTKSLS